MKRHLGLGNLFAGTVLVAIAANPAHAAATVITDINLSSTRSGLELRLETQKGENPEIFAMRQGDTYQVDLVNTQLQLPDGDDEFIQANPAPGIKSITLTQLNGQSVRVKVVGEANSPAVDVAKHDNRLVLNLDTTPGAAAKQATPIPTELETLPGDAIAQADEPQPQPEEADPGPQQTEQRPEVMVPDPDITIDGVSIPEPTLQTAPPFLPRAVAPPVGDISISTINATAPGIDLGTAERVPRLVLREAPARDVLALLARAAGLNLAFTGQGGEGGDEGPRISLDIENEPVQDVFNYVLQLSGLQANRVGRTIFVGEVLPTGARNVVSRTFRMNQVSADGAAAFLATMGAETTQTITTEQTDVISVDTGVEGAAPITRATTTTQTQIQELTYTAIDAPRVLVGLQAIADSRLNSVTLLGEPRLVDLAAQFLVQLDLRRRQVAVNVKIIDINLSATDEFGTSFSFGLDDTGIIQDGGTGIINFGNSTPAGAGIFNVGSVIGATASTPFSVSQFLLQLRAQITNGNANILTDPTLVIQEGQTASVNLTQDVITEVETEISASTPPVTTITTTTEEAGLILSVAVERIDDNGFVSVNVLPTVSAIAQQVDVTLGGGGSQEINLLSRREVSSGTIRMRDGQSLVLTGIIQDQERATVSKIPILGDIPILGALFRSTTRQNVRNELIVLLTPQILDDSDQSVYGYGYQPSEDIQEILDRSQVEQP